jgi:heme/copper-type cytochrome/quinol oxidase subunit 2
MKRSYMYTIGIILVVVLLVLAACKTKQPTAPQTTAPKAPAPAEKKTDDSLTGSAVADIVAPEDPSVIKVVAKDMKFWPNTIAAKRGEKIRLQVTAEDRDYGFSLAEFHISESVKQGETVVVEFTPDLYGTFIFFSRIEWNNGKIGELGRLVISLN